MVGRWTLSRFIDYRTLSLLSFYRYQIYNVANVCLLNNSIFNNNPVPIFIVMGIKYQNGSLSSRLLSRKRNVISVVFIRVQLCKNMIFTV